MPARILIVEDGEPLAQLMRVHLEAAGYKVDAVERNNDLETCLRESVPDLVVLDTRLRERSASDLCRQVRAYADTITMPIIALVARNEDGLRSLDAGADDFVAKPLPVFELLERVRALLRRAAPARTGAILRAADVELDRERHRVTHAKQDVHLRPTEFRLLEFLMRSPGRVFSRHQLLKGIWGPKANIDVRTVDVHIGRLRRALKMGNRMNPVTTVRGAGYAFRQEHAS